MKWCRNFYTEEECVSRYQGGDKTISILSVEKEGSSNKPESSTNNTIRAGVVLVAIALALWCCYKKMNFSGKSEYSRLDTRYTGGEDEVELL
eukprot:TRINITY_DN4334_c0_g1_i1.p1 TRINITY_DN4334_c0_g1~~TRINITY_DN4334_c0_g1_i1.p1  ORF type:complete len:92 (+),score=6.61 TRINITY_DN4334_c0_g1_i1:170-445(+)